MELQTDMPPRPPLALFRTWGVWALMAGAMALILVMVQIAGPSLEPKPSAGTQIGEIAGEIKRAAWRSFLGLPEPAPEPVPMSTRVFAYLGVAAPVLAVVAVVLSAISGVMREHWRFPVYATSLGAAAILFQFFWWVALLVVGVVLLVAILENIGDIFSF